MSLKSLMFGALVTWGRLGWWWWLSFPGIILFCEPQFFLKSAQSGVQTFIFYLFFFFTIKIQDSLQEKEMQNMKDITYK